MLKAKDITVAISYMHPLTSLWWLSHVINCTQPYIRLAFTFPVRSARLAPGRFLPQKWLLVGYPQDFPWRGEHGQNGLQQHAAPLAIADGSQSLGLRRLVHPLPPDFLCGLLARFVFGRPTARVQSCAVPIGLGSAW